MTEASARPAPSPEEVFAVLNEAQHRLDQASKAFNAFMALLPGEHESDIDHEQLYWLLNPIRCEVSAALDELQTVSPNHQPQ